MTTTPSNDTQTGSTTNGNGSTTPTGKDPIVSDEALSAAEQAATQPPAGVDTRSTLRDLHPPVHEETETTGKKGGNARLAGKIAIVLAFLCAAMLAAFVLGTRNAEPTTVTKTVPAAVPSTFVPKDMDDSACVFQVAPQGAKYKPGWCGGKTAGAYLFDDDTVAYCSCGKPRGK